MADSIASKYTIPPDAKIVRLVDRMAELGIEPKHISELPFADELAKRMMRSVMRMEQYNRDSVASAEMAVRGLARYAEHTHDHVASFGNLSAQDRTEWQSAINGAQASLADAYLEVQRAQANARDTTITEFQLKMIAGFLNKPIDEVRAMHRSGFSGYV